MPNQYYPLEITVSRLLNGHKLYPKDNIKYLGVYLDSTLSGEEHCKVLASKLRRANGLLSKLRHYVVKDELISIYHSLFSSHLTYGAQIWGQQHNCQTDIITRLQNRALRILNFEDLDADPNPLYKEHGILKVNDIIKIKNIELIYDYQNNLLPQSFQNDFLKLENIYTSVRTRNSRLGCLFVPRRNSTKYGLNSISHQSILTWNTFTRLLNRNLALMPRNELKCQLKRHFLQLY